MVNTNTSLALNASDDSSKCAGRIVWMGICESHIVIHWVNKRFGQRAFEDWLSACIIYGLYVCLLSTATMRPSSVHSPNWQLVQLDRPRHAYEQKIWSTLWIICSFVTANVRPSEPLYWIPSSNLPRWPDANPRKSNSTLCTSHSIVLRSFARPLHIQPGSVGFFSTFSNRIILSLPQSLPMLFR